MTIPLDLLAKIFGPCASGEAGGAGAPSIDLAALLRALQQPGGNTPATIPFLRSACGIATASGDTKLLPALSKQQYNVMAYCLTTQSTAALVVAFVSEGASPKELWKLQLKASSSNGVGANLATTYPSALFNTQSDSALVLNLDGVQTVYWSIVYWES